MATALGEGSNLFTKDLCGEGVSWLTCPDYITKEKVGNEYMHERKS